MRFAALVLVALSIGCRKTPPSADADAAPAPATTPTVAAAEPTEGDPASPPPRDLPPAEAPRDNLEFDTGVIEEKGKTTTVVKMDPFDQAANEVRSASVPCFASLPPGEYNAAIDVSITPSGTATRVEVVSGPDDAGIRKCLKDAASRSYPSSADGKKMLITVQVKG
jgi:hypothetical protein